MSEPPGVSIAVPEASSGGSGGSSPKAQEARRTKTASLEMRTIAEGVLAEEGGVRRQHAKGESNQFVAQGKPVG